MIEKLQIFAYIITPNFPKSYIFYVVHLESWFLMANYEFLGVSINDKFSGCTHEDYDKCLKDAGYKRDTYKLPSEYSIYSNRS